MRRIILAAIAIACAACFSSPSSASDPLAYSGFPFGYGFYQPYGIRYSTSVRTPPYFAVNPPVYYGARHYRPYGASPFASLPLVQPGETYRTRPEVPSPMRAPAVIHQNPYCQSCEGTEAKQMAQGGGVIALRFEDTPVEGKIRLNPFVTPKVAETPK